MAHVDIVFEVNINQRRLNAFIWLVRKLRLKLFVLKHWRKVWRFASFFIVTTKKKC
jgi:hypothetical protein